MAKKSSASQLGGALVFLGSLVYLYVFFTWYSGGGSASAWLGTATFLGPFVIVGSVIGAVMLFFMGVAGAVGQVPKDPKMMAMTLWKFVVITAGTTLILTGGGPQFYIALIAFILTYLGAAAASM